MRNNSFLNKITGQYYQGGYAITSDDNVAALIDKGIAGVYDTRNANRRVFRDKMFQSPGTDMSGDSNPYYYRRGASPFGQDNYFVDNRLVVQSELAPDGSTIRKFRLTAMSSNKDLATAISQAARQYHVDRAGSSASETAFLDLEANIEAADAYQFQETAEVQSYRQTLGEGLSLFMEAGTNAFNYFDPTQEPNRRLKRALQPFFKPVESYSSELRNFYTKSGVAINTLDSDRLANDDFYLNMSAIASSAMQVVMANHFLLDTVGIASVRKGIKFNEDPLGFRSLLNVTETPTGILSAPTLASFANVFAAAGIGPVAFSEATIFSSFFQQEGQINQMLIAATDYLLNPRSTVKNSLNKLTINLTVQAPSSSITSGNLEVFAMAKNLLQLADAEYGGKLDINLAFLQQGRGGSIVLNSDALRSIVGGRTYLDAFTSGNVNAIDDMIRASGVFHEDLSSGSSGGIEHQKNISVYGDGQLIAFAGLGKQNLTPSATGRMSEPYTNPSQFNQMFVGLHGSNLLNDSTLVGKQIRQYSAGVESVFTGASLGTQYQQLLVTDAIDAVTKYQTTALIDTRGPIGTTGSNLNELALDKLLQTVLDEGTSRGYLLTNQLDLSSNTISGISTKILKALNTDRFTLMLGSPLELGGDVRLEQARRYFDTTNPGEFDRLVAAGKIRFSSTQRFQHQTSMLVTNQYGDAQYGLMTSANISARALRSNTETGLFIGNKDSHDPQLLGQLKSGLQELGLFREDTLSGRSPIYSSTAEFNNAARQAFGTKASWNKASELIRQTMEFNQKGGLNSKLFMQEHLPGIPQSGLRIRLKYAGEDVFNYDIGFTEKGDIYMQKYDTLISSMLINTGDKERVIAGRTFGANQTVKLNSAQAIIALGQIAEYQLVQRLRAYDRALDNPDLTLTDTVDKMRLMKYRIIKSTGTNEDLSRFNTEEMRIIFKMLTKASVPIPTKTMGYSQLGDSNKYQPFMYDDLFTTNEQVIKVAPVSPDSPGVEGVVYNLDGTSETMYSLSMQSQLTKGYKAKKLGAITQIGDPAASILTMEAAFRMQAYDKLDDVTGNTAAGTPFRIPMVAVLTAHKSIGQLGQRTKNLASPRFSYQYGQFNPATNQFRETGLPEPVYHMGYGEASDALRLAQLAAIERPREPLQVVALTTGEAGLNPEIGYDLLDTTQVRLVDLTIRFQPYKTTADQNTHNNLVTKLRDLVTAGNFYTEDEFKVAVTNLQKSVGMGAGFTVEVPNLAENRTGAKMQFVMINVDPEQSGNTAVTFKAKLYTNPTARLLDTKGPTAGMNRTYAETQANALDGIYGGIGARRFLRLSNAVQDVLMNNDVFDEDKLFVNDGADFRTKLKGSLATASPLINRLVSPKQFKYGTQPKMSGALKLRYGALMATNEDDFMKIMELRNLQTHSSTKHLQTLTQEVIEDVKKLTESLVNKMSKEQIDFYNKTPPEVKAAMQSYYTAGSPHGFYNELYQFIQHADPAQYINQLFKEAYTEVMSPQSQKFGFILPAKQAQAHKLDFTYYLIEAVSLYTQVKTQVRASRIPANEELDGLVSSVLGQMLGAKPKDNTALQRLQQIIPNFNLITLSQDTFRADDTRFGRKTSANMFSQYASLYEHYANDSDHLGFTANTPFADLVGEQSQIGLLRQLTQQAIGRMFLVGAFSQGLTEFAPAFDTQWHGGLDLTHLVVNEETRNQAMAIHSLYDSMYRSAKESAVGYVLSSTNKIDLNTKIQTLVNTSAADRTAGGINETDMYKYRQEVLAARQKGTVLIPTFELGAAIPNAVRVHRNIESTILDFELIPVLGAEQLKQLSINVNPNRDNADQYINRLVLSQQEITKVFNQMPTSLKEIDPDTNMSKIQYMSQNVSNANGKKLINYGLSIEEYSYLKSLNEAKRNYITALSNLLDSDTYQQYLSTTIHRAAGGSGVTMESNQVKLGEIALGLNPALRVVNDYVTKAKSNKSYYSGGADQEILDSGFDILTKAHTYTNPKFFVTNPFTLDETTLKSTLVGSTAGSSILDDIKLNGYSLRHHAESYGILDPTTKQGYDRNLLGVINDTFSMLKVDAYSDRFFSMFLRAGAPQGVAPAALKVITLRTLNNRAAGRRGVQLGFANNSDSIFVSKFAMGYQQGDYDGDMATIQALTSSAQAMAERDAIIGRRLGRTPTTTDISQAVTDSTNRLRSAGQAVNTTVIPYGTSGVDAVHSTYDALYGVLGPTSAEETAERIMEDKRIVSLHEQVTANVTSDTNILATFKRQSRVLSGLNAQTIEDSILLNKFGRAQYESTTKIIDHFHSAEFETVVSTELGAAGAAAFKSASVEDKLNTIQGNPTLSQHLAAYSANEGTVNSYLKLMFPVIMPQNIAAAATQQTAQVATKYMGMLYDTTSHIFSHEFLQADSMGKAKARTIESVSRIAYQMQMLGREGIKPNAATGVSPSEMYTALNQLYENAYEDKPTKTKLQPAALDQAVQATGLLNPVADYISAVQGNAGTPLTESISNKILTNLSYGALAAHVGSLSSDEIAHDFAKEVPHTKLQTIRRIAANLFQTLDEELVTGGSSEKITRLVTLAEDSLGRSAMNNSDIAALRAFATDTTGTVTYTKDLQDTMNRVLQAHQYHDLFKFVTSTLNERELMASRINTSNTIAPFGEAGLGSIDFDPLSVPDARNKVNELMHKGLLNIQKMYGVQKALTTESKADIGDLALAAAHIGQALITESVNFASREGAGTTITDILGRGKLHNVNIKEIMSGFRASIDETMKTKTFSDAVDKILEYSSHGPRAFPGEIYVNGSGKIVNGVSYIRATGMIGTDPSTASYTHEYSTSAGPQSKVIDYETAKRIVGRKLIIDRAISDASRLGISGQTAKETMMFIAQAAYESTSAPDSNEHNQNLVDLSNALHNNIKQMNPYEANEMVTRLAQSNELRAHINPPSGLIRNFKNAMSNNTPMGFLGYGMLAVTTIGASIVGGALGRESNTDPAELGRSVGHGLMSSNTFAPMRSAFMMASDITSAVKSMRDMSDSDTRHEILGGYALGLAGNIVGSTILSDVITTPIAKFIGKEGTNVGELASRGLANMGSGLITAAFGALAAGLSAAMAVRTATREESPVTSLTAQAIENEYEQAQAERYRLELINSAGESDVLNIAEVSITDSIDEYDDSELNQTSYLSSINNQEYEYHFQDVAGNDMSVMTT